MVKGKGVDVATVLTVYGIETQGSYESQRRYVLVATVLTVYGIETWINLFRVLMIFKLQQYLPFTVLKLN